MHQHGGIPKTPRFGLEIEMPSRQFTCHKCGALFGSDEQAPKYCGRQCYDAARTLPKRICLVCSKSFAPRHSTREYCSKTCAGASRRRRRIVACKKCGRQFEVSRSDADARYCSRACLWVARRRSAPKVCAHCQKTMDLRPSEAHRKYCSVACKYAVVIDEGGQNRFGAKNGRSTFTCQECGVEIGAHKYLADRRKFCGGDCATRWRLRHTPAPVVAFSCVWCGQHFERRKSYADHYPGRVKFCSRACNGAHSARYKQNRVSVTETEFFDRLASAGLRFTRQVRVRQFVVDAMCTDTNVVIEFDGEYWHSLERIREKDERKADAIAWAGCKLVRVPERDWLDSPEATIQRVLEEV
jgi:very-short-patch-repair endonuclease